jgi:hypothetical protein
MDTQESKVCNSNIEKLKLLVSELDKRDSLSEEYQTILKEIEKIIKEEKEIINKLKRSEVKVKHYESICAAILSLIATTKMAS